MFKIRLDGGHGAGVKHNRGATCYNEGDNNYYYSLVLKKELEKLDGVKVDLTRNNINQDPSLSARAAMGAGYDLFLSLHSNGAVASVRGTEILDSVARPNKALATKLVKAISDLFNHNNRGVKYIKNSSGGDYYGVLRGNKAKSAMIIEHGFHSNSQDCNFFKNNHLAIAQATTNVIANHYNLKGSQSTVNKDKGYYVFGDKGEGVTQLQVDLKALGYNVDVSGGFGKQVESVVKEFQKDNNLDVDGSAGPATLNKIKHLLSIKKDADDLYKVQVGAYSKKENAEKELKELKSKGIDGYIKKE